MNYFWKRLMGLQATDRKCLCNRPECTVPGLDLRSHNRKLMKDRLWPKIEIEMCGLKLFFMGRFNWV